MCNQIKIINKTTNGIISKNKNAEMYQIVFKNLQFSFSLMGYNQFTYYIFELKNAFEEHQKDSCCNCKNVTIPTAHETLQILLNKNELEELCDLFSLKKNYKNISNKIDFGFSLN